MKTLIQFCLKVLYKQSLNLLIKNHKIGNFMPLLYYEYINFKKKLKLISYINHMILYQIKYILLKKSIFINIFYRK